MLSPTSSAFRSGGDHARIIQGPILVLKRALQQIIDQWTYYYLLSSVFFCMCQPKWLLLLLLCQYTSISSKPKPTVLSPQRFFLIFMKPFTEYNLRNTKSCWNQGRGLGVIHKPFAGPAVPIQLHICFDNSLADFFFHRLASLIPQSMVNNEYIMYILHSPYYIHIM